MLLFNALQELAAQPAHFARRPCGVILQLTDRMKICTFRTGREYRWCPKYRDLVASDWEVVSLDRLQQEMRAMQQQQELLESQEADANGE